MNKDDELVILLAKEGKESAFRELYENNYEKVYRIAFRYTKSKQDAEDIMQETFIKAFRGIKSFNFNISSDFTAWICQIGVHCSLDYLRKCKRRKTDKTEYISTLSDELEAKDSSPEKSAIMAQAIAHVKNALHLLSPKQRLIFDLRHLQHMDIKDIAENLQCSQSTIKKQLQRAVSRLRKRLEPLWGEQ
ncbi:MAG: sigma-70 family RNA polymerase sigma factor [Candidatus Aminicenantes bacterium]|nr:sigma-70 family RNA polymerase sigma factor [Candidatus Aminicenantes bacterium]